MVLRLSNQLEMLGFDETVRRAEADAKTDAERRRMVRRIEVAHELMSELPAQGRTVIPSQRFVPDRPPPFPAGQ
jgi:hypothetical protein